MVNILKHRYIYLSIPWALALFSLFVFIFWNLNLWIDMTWWTQSEYSFSWEVDFSNVRQNVENYVSTFNNENWEVINWVNVYKITWEEKIVVEVWYNSFEETKLEGYKTNFNEKILWILNSWDSKNFELTKYQNIGQSFWAYIQKTAIITLVLSLVSISVYLAFAFFWIASGFSSLSFAIITLITLFHDIILATGFYILSSMFFGELKIDTYFVTALLTILWYSINDTIVVFDRIRENIKKHLKSHKLDEIINISISETLARSIFTSLTVFFVLLAIFIFGPEALKWFMLALIYWVLFWTYSSIFIASPLLYELNKNKELKAYEKKVLTPEDKIVV